MYLEYYGLRKRPFDVTPDPSFFFPSQKHSEALASLIYAVTEKRGFVVITGEIGSGKTTVCRTLLQKLDPAARVALITNTTLTTRQLLEAICGQFGLRTEKQTKVSLLNRLDHFLREQNDAGNTIVLIVDEAQNLTVRSLEEIRLISNMETDTQKLIQIMLLGQPELRDKLNRPELEQLRQRISLRYHLRSLDREETRRYIEHRLNVAGDKGRARFTKRAVDFLYQFSRGTPRIINIICDQALLMGYLRESTKIDEAIIREIAAEFSVPAEEQKKPQQVHSAEERSSRLRRFFRRRRDRSPQHAQSTPPAQAEPTGPAPLNNVELQAISLEQEQQIVQKLAGLRLAGILAENGHFVATIDGVQLSPGDHLFEMEVAQVEKNKIVFGFRDKRYQLAIENTEDLPDSDLLSMDQGTKTNTERGAPGA